MRKLRRGDLDLDVFEIVRTGRSIVHGLPSERFRASGGASERARQETLELVVETDLLDFLLEPLDGGVTEAEPLSEGFVPELHGWNRPSATPDPDTNDDESVGRPEEAEDEIPLTRIMLHPGRELTDGTPLPDSSPTTTRLCLPSAV